MRKILVIEANKNVVKNLFDHYDSEPSEGGIFFIFKFVLNFFIKILLVVKTIAAMMRKKERQI